MRVNLVMRISLLIVVPIFFCGCVEVRQPTHLHRPQGKVFILPGIEGRSLNNENIARGLVDGGVEDPVAIFDWTTWTGAVGWYIHLADAERNRIQSIRLARAIVRHQKKHPGGPVFLIAHSGGAEIVIEAVAFLSRSQPVEGVILLAGAVSPGRDLTGALERTRRGIWNFYSRYDVGFLVLGTTLFGTSDREFGAAAGAVGFDVPPDAPLYAHKLFQVPYVKAMAGDGNFGTHSGWTHPRFVARWLAPIVLGSDSPAFQPPQPSTEASETRPAVGMSTPEQH